MKIDIKILVNYKIRLQLRQKMRPLVLKIEKRCESFEEEKSPPIDFDAKQMSYLMTDGQSNDLSFSK